jgi:NAD(P)-dependent dehydrogenase (short-subunit alcohol dehydrogenase family)
MSTPFHLENQTILISGASSGIGSCVAEHISKMGGLPVLTGRDRKKLEETALRCGNQPLIIEADLCDAASREQLCELVPTLNGFVNCAGTVHPFPVRFIDQKKLDETMNINFEAPLLVTGLLLKKKKIAAGSSLVYISSVSSDRPQAGASLYGASKAGIEAMVKVLAQELGSQKIRVNSVSPAMVRTPMYDKAEALVSKEEMDAHIAEYILGVGYPEDVANAIVFLLSSASRWITGTTIRLDGGLLL